MPEGTTGSTVPRRQLGRYLRDLRNQARLTVRAAAKVLEWSEPKLWRIETGQTSMRSLDVEAMCRIYGADAKLTEALMGLAKETKARGWWHSYGDAIPETFDLYIGLEEAAEELNSYEGELVPGLLQTAEYARCIIGTDSSSDPSTLDPRVTVRINRQGVLTRTTRPLRANFALSEAVLRRLIGSPEIMEGQLDHLIEMAGLPTVELRVVPFSAGLHPGVLSGGFVRLGFPTTPDGRETEPPTVYVDCYAGALYLEKPHEIAQYDGAFAGIWDAALDAQSTINLIKQTATELRKP